MTGRPTFGDFARAASWYLDHRSPQFAAVATRPDPDEVARQVGLFTQGLDRVLAVLGRYLGDVSKTFGGAAGQEPHRLTPWARASIEAGDALRNAAVDIQGAENRSRWAGRPPLAEPQACGLDDAAASLAAGRDLLRTHLNVEPGGVQAVSSEWTPVILSMAVTRALLVEVAGWVRQIVAPGAYLALSRATSDPSVAQEQRRLNTACQWLWRLASAVEEAQRQEPVLEDDIRMLHAIPVNRLEARRLPDGRETVGELCRGSIDCAERVQHVATVAVPVAAGQARITWLRAARAWYQIKTDAKGRLAAETVEASDLALWTGRLAHADPAWTPSLGPSDAVRPPEALAPEAGDIGGVLAVVHHASVTLGAIGAADFRQIRAAGTARRLLVPTSSLSEKYDIPRAFTRAPSMRAEALLGAYREAGTASVQASAEISEIVADIRAPSITLNWARAVVQASNRGPQRAGVGDLVAAASMPRPVRGSDRLAGALVAPDTQARAPQA